MMEQKESKKRKCGPRVKTGCITCRIRRVKCDEAKPACVRCTSTGRKCDGYVPPKVAASTKALSRRQKAPMDSIAQSLNVMSVMPFNFGTSHREQQLFHFYCVQGAFDLSVYMNSSFWHNMILQYSQYHHVVRQAVVAFGASHVFAITMNDQHQISDDVNEGLEQAMQYDKGIRALRQYMEESQDPDPHVILICCALFFSCENGRGNRAAALQHLERGLTIMNAQRSNRSSAIQASMGNDGGPLIAAKPAVTDMMAQGGTNEIDDELLYVFSRLDCQATLCDANRPPMLDLDQMAPVSDQSPESMPSTFTDVTDAQRHLDLLHNRLVRFITAYTEYKQDTLTDLPDFVRQQKESLLNMCNTWELAMNSLIGSQQPAVTNILRYDRAGKHRDDPNWQTALQIQLLVLHHRCWWMLFRSSFPEDSTVFTMSPNPRAEEILDICEFLGFSLPVKPLASVPLTAEDITWKLISEVGVAAPIFVLATKCTDPAIRDRAMRQMTALREHRKGIYDKMFLDKVIDAIPASTSLTQSAGEWNLGQDFPRELSPDAFFDLDATDQSFDSGSSDQSPETSKDTADSPQMYETRELLGWSRKTSIG